MLTQAREHIIRKTFEAVKGAPKAIVHVYNSTSVSQREQVFRKSKEEILKIADNETRTKITEKFRTLGFSYVTLDLQGFRSGSMNETLGK